ncbi:MAG: PAS domain S-box [Bacteroidetes bacterium]|nr:MAG: PAS domain S-box [Bacteroidota bacterium]
MKAMMRKNAKYALLLLTGLLIAAGSILMVYASVERQKLRMSIASLVLTGKKTDTIQAIRQLEEFNSYSDTWSIISIGTILGTLVITFFSLRRQQEKSVELKLLRQKQCFMAAFEQSSDAFILMNRKEEIFFTSASIKNVLGYEKEQMSADLTGHVHPDDLSKVQAHISRLFQEPSSEVRDVIMIRHSDGTYHCIETIGRNLLHVPEINSVIINLRNINADMQAREKLRESEKRFRMVAENMRDIVSIHDEKGCYTYISPSITELLGYQPEELLGMSPLHFCHPDDHKNMFGSYRSISEGRYFSPLEFRLKHKNDYYVWVETLTRPFFDRGRLTGFQSETRDITEQKLLEHELQFQAAILDELNESVIATNSQGRVIYWNKGAERIFGYTAHEMSGKKTNHLFEPVQAQTSGETWENVPATGELVAIRKDKSETVLEARTTSMQNGKQKTLCHIQVAADISERKQAEEKVKAAYGELEQFAYATSHDLQEPLRMVSGFLTLLEKRYGDLIDAQGKEFIHFAIDGSKRMSTLIQHLLLYSRTGRSGESIRQVDMDKLLDNVRMNLYRSIEESGAKITASGKLPVISGYAAELERLLQNLLENAIKYHREGVPPEITVGFSEGESEWQFQVEDNGTGVPTDQNKRIFEPFTRIGGSKRGSGLGLATCSKIARIHRGKISCEPRLGNGSVFKFTIPKFMEPQLS